MKALLFAAAISLLACNAATAQTLLGRWQIEAAAVAPWVAPEGLFQGSLPEPKGEIARALGLHDGITPGVDVACPNSRFSYHFRDKDTALFALDNVIYTLKRR